MRNMNLASKSPNPEGEDPDPIGDVPPRNPGGGGGGKGRRLLYIVGAFVIVVGGGYIALTQFTQVMAPAPQAPTRPIRPIAKAPTPTTPTPPAGAPAPSKAAPAQAGQVPPGGGAPAGEPAKAEPPAPAAPAAALPAPTAPAKTEVKGPAAKPGEPVKVAKAAPAEPPAASAPPVARQAPPEPQAAAGTFSLQVGAMISEGNAQKLKQRLEQLGYSAAIRKGRVHLRRHVVSTGDFPDRAGAEGTAKRLAAQGIAARVMESAGRFSVEAGSFTNEDDAIDLARQLQRLNYPPRIQDRAQNTTVYQVRLGAFGSKAEAQAKGAELKGKGFPYVVVKN